MQNKNMGPSSFVQRFGVNTTKPISSDFPISGRIALAHLLLTLDEQNAIKGNGRSDLYREIVRTGRLDSPDYKFRDIADFIELILEPLKKMEWHQVFTLCERIYRNHLREMGHYIHIDTYDGGELEFIADFSLQDTQQYFTNELNEILEEENIAFHFVNGRFQRRGYAQTQKNIQRVGSVLGHPKLGRVRDYYNQARKDFDKHPEPDLEHCVLSCMQALEACLEILTGKPASNDFQGVLSKLQGNGLKQIPPPIVTAMTKLYAYRGSGKGVAHAALGGNRVEEHDAELVLSVTAAYITYLVALLLEEEDIPF